MHYTIGLRLASTPIFVTDLQNFDKVQTDSKSLAENRLSKHGL
jgi:hypothetical protein